MEFQNLMVSVSNLVEVSVFDDISEYFILWGYQNKHEGHYIHQEYLAHVP